jgi:hypothetical protein
MAQLKKGKKVFQQMFSFSDTFLSNKKKTTKNLASRRSRVLKI